MWTYADIKQADAALSPEIDDPAAAADALNAQAVPGPTVAVSVAAIHSILMLAPAGDWLRIEALAATAHSSGWPSTSTEQDAAISAAKLAVELAGSKVETIDPQHWQSVLAFLGGLHGAGVVSDDALAQIEALEQPVLTVPKWQPALNAGHIQTARSL